MSEEHVAFAEDGYKLSRIWTKPNAAVDSKWDAHNPQDFVRKTANKKGTYGDLLDKSKELSIEREEKMGVDPIKEKFYENYAKRRQGKEHPDVKKKKLKESLKKNKFFGWKDD